MKTATPETIDLDLITVPEARRPLDKEAVARLAKSMSEIGLRTPVTVLSINDGERLDLVAGAHRLAAARSLAWPSISCFVIEGDSLDAEMWEIAENLLRVDLTKEQRDQQIRRYAELLTERREKLGQIVQVSGGRGIKSVATEIAEKTGLKSRTVRRAMNPPQPITRADPPKEVFDVHERNRSRLMSAWNSATAEDREWFREWIDTPIMDGRYAA